MGSSPDDFSSLQKVLRVNRYEHPPPRYFDEFSSRVIARIERGEARTSWWERFGFDLRRALAGRVGLLACSLVVYAVAPAGGDGSFPNAVGVNEFTGVSGVQGIAAPAIDPLAADVTSAN